MVKFCLGNLYYLAFRKRLIHQISGKLLAILLLAMGLFQVQSVAAKQVIYVAVASNFLTTLKQLKTEFERSHASELIISAGSTGKLYAQITHGAPYDIFFSADDLRPQQLVNQGFTKNHRAFTYALGKLVVFHPTIESAQFTPSMLTDQKVQHIAIANPKLAPYGLAAKNWLLNNHLWQSVNHKVVMGENVNQAMQFVQSSNAQIAIIGLSMAGELPITSYTKLEPRDYQLIRQQAVVLTNNNYVSEFVAFMQTEPAQKIIQSSGYSLP